MDAVCKWCIIIMKNKKPYHLHAENMVPQEMGHVLTWTSDREYALRFDRPESAREYRELRLKNRKDVHIKQLIF